MPASRTLSKTHRSASLPAVLIVQYFVLGLALAFALAVLTRPAQAEDGSLPPVIPAYGMSADPTGSVATYQAGERPVATGTNAFFQPLGSNGRSCFTCHRPETGWTVSAAAARARFDQSQGLEPLFRAHDGATCSSADVSSLEARRRAFALLTSQGLIRVGMTMPSPAEFTVAGVVDPYNCTSNPATGLVSPSAGTVSVYRRPLPATNLGFLSTIMWDGREPSLTSQATDATIGHAEAASAPTQSQLQQIVGFEIGLYTAQIVDGRAGILNSAGSNGGPVGLAFQPFFIGINDPAGNNPRGTPFNPLVFNLFEPWGANPGLDPGAAQRQSIARGEAIFNTRPIRITGVGGLNDLEAQPVIRGTCSTCHDAPNAGSHSVDTTLDIGIAGRAPPGLDVAALPRFTLACHEGALAGASLETSDPGRALVTGKCADIGKFKVPGLRGLAARAPYFHNGAAASLADVVGFYERRFRIALRPQERADLVNFLLAL
ncbi:MAG: hypothetical protein HYR63_18350 [Proteobacteria bacterium]|nr:hypothetical protein [Pseudomonadota bacterium]MBI3499503.1 hypothetical protein [Pseudomonadota bacterium]